jgi:hypothetical protein
MDWSLLVEIDLDGHLRRETAVDKIALAAIFGKPNLVEQTTGKAPRQLFSTFVLGW